MFSEHFCYFDIETPVQLAENCIKCPWTQACLGRPTNQNKPCFSLVPSEALLNMLWDCLILLQIQKTTWVCPITTFWLLHSGMPWIEGIVFCRWGNHCPKVVNDEWKVQGLDWVSWHPWARGGLSLLSGMPATTLGSQRSTDKAWQQLCMGEHIPT